MSNNSTFYFEYIEGNIALARKKCTAKLLSESDANFFKKVTHTEAYVSTFTMGANIKNYLKVNNGSIEGYSGVFSSNVLWMDLDEKSKGSIEKNIEYSKSELLKLIKYFVNTYNFDLDNFYIFFSGSKGFHLGIPSIHFGGFKEDSELPRKIKSMVSEQFKSQCSIIDLSIYKSTGLLRVPNSKHIKTGYYKIPITYEELTTLSASEIFELAKSPRLDFKYKPSVDRIVYKDLQHLWGMYENESVDLPETIYEDRTIEEIDEVKFKQVDNLIKAIEEKEIDITQDYDDWIHISFGLVSEFGEKGREFFHRLSKFWKSSDGLKSYNEKDCNKIYDQSLDRQKRGKGGITISHLFYVSKHYGILLKDYDKTNKGKNALYKDALYLIQKDVELSFVSKMLHSANKAYSYNIPQETIRKIIDFASKKIKDGKITNNLTESVKVLNDIIPEYIESLSPNYKKITLLDKDFDDTTRGRLNGKLILLIGRGGSKKSLYAQYMAGVNAVKNEVRAYYSNMEMPNTQVLDRFVNNILKLEQHNNERINPSETLEQVVKKDPLLAEKIVKEQVGDKFGNMFLVDGSADMKASAYIEKVRAYEAKINSKIGMLIVDGVSMMSSEKKHNKSMDDEVDKSKELKEVAKLLNIPIFGIAHVPKSVGVEKRDLENDPLGSVKWQNNADMFISFSKVRTRNSLDNPNVPVEYDPLKAYVLMNDKRGKGKIIRKIFKMHPGRLVMESTEEDPLEYDVGGTRGSGVDF